jgi:hypothetical protein
MMARQEKERKEKSEEKQKGKKLPIFPSRNRYLLPYLYIYQVHIYGIIIRIVVVVCL